MTTQEDGVTPVEPGATPPAASETDSVGVEPTDDAATQQGTETEQPGIDPRSDDEEDRAAHYA